MKLTDIASEYVALKQSMGMGFATEAAILKAFCRAMRSAEIQEVSCSAVLNFLEGKGALTSFWHKKHQTLRGFFRFAMGRGHVSCLPLPALVPRLPDPIPPYIYTIDELRRLIAATNILESGKGKISAPTLRTLLQTLYGSGLRLSEAITLTFKDVNLQERVLIIRNTKFFKTRLVPVGPQLTCILQTYEINRQRLPRPSGDDSTFLATRAGTALTRCSAERYFRRICDQAGIRRVGGPRFQPRLHDLRHSFAVHRLCEWYRQGADVQRLLLQLSTYLGHVGIASTQRYLTMTSDLLHEANQRFEQYAAPGVKNV